MTRKPLKLVTGPRSLFFYKKPWGLLPDILYEHGYKAELFHLPFKASAGNSSTENIRLKSCLQRKSDLENSHIVIDALSYEELKPAFIDLKHSTVTIIDRPKSDSNLISDTASKKIHSSELKIPVFKFTVDSPTSSVLHTCKFNIYKIHQMWLKLFKRETLEASCFFINPSENEYFKFIDHCVTLAELDFLEET